MSAWQTPSPAARCPSSGAYETARRGCGRMSAVLILIVVVAFLVVIVGSLTLGRWMQRKGRAMEQGRKDPDL